MPLSNTERQKRWIEKNRALHNLRRRKKILNGGDTTSKNEASSNDLVVKRRSVDDQSAPVQPSKMDELRTLVKMVTAEPIAPAPKPLIYRNDYGQIISETQWRILQKRKQEAIAGGYVLDEYSQ